MAKVKLGADDSSVNVRDVLDEDEWYELLPIEKKLISYTLGLGITFMVIFIIAFKILK